MRLIDYDKYTKKWTPRSVVVLLLVESLVTGFLLGLALMEGIVSNKSSVWIFPLVLAFGSGVGVLQTTLVALHNCQTAAKTPSTEAAVN
jgi:hypothetical protein